MPPVVILNKLIKLTSHLACRSIHSPRGEKAKTARGKIRYLSKEVVPHTQNIPEGVDN